MALINEIKQHYDSFIETAHMAGALDEKTKELIHIAVVLAMKCEP